MIGRSGRYYPGESLRESWERHHPFKEKREYHLGQLAGSPSGHIVKIDWVERAYWTVVAGEPNWNDSRNWTRHDMGAP